MTCSNPLLESSDDENVIDVEYVRKARGGSRDALEALVTRHQVWIYNIVRRMTFNRDDAEDATQEILVKLITRIGSFEFRSTFRTWLYRIVVNHVLNMKRGRSEAHGLTFPDYAESLERAPDADLPVDHSLPADINVLVEEAKALCTSGMLLCLDREQRLVYILGEIIGVSSSVGAELLDVNADAFRQKLARARRDLYSFLRGQCGLVNPANPCRCAKKTRAFIEAGYVNPNKLMFLTKRMTDAREKAPQALQLLESLDEQCAVLYRSNEFVETPDFIASLRGVLHSWQRESILDATE